MTQPVRPVDYTLSEADFVDNWLRFGCFHRSRVVAAFARLALGRPRDARKASLHLALMAESTFALEDMAIWSEALRAQATTGKHIVHCVDEAKPVWSIFFDNLRRSTPSELAALFAIEIRATENDGSALLSQLQMWSNEAVQIADLALTSDPNGGQLLNRIVNKTKHGALVLAGNELEGGVSIAIPPREIGTATLLKASISDEFIAAMARQVFHINRLTCLLVGQWYTHRFGVKPGISTDVLRFTPQDGDLDRMDAILDSITMPDLYSGSPAATDNQ